MAARTLNRLTDRAIRQAKEPGWYADGGGLYLRIDAGGAKRWVFVFQWHKKRTEMGLGALADKSLAEARDDREQSRKLVAAGKNPVDERRRVREAQIAAANAEAPKTFGEWAEEIAPSIGPHAEKARKAWVAMMKEKVGALSAKPPADVTTEDVLRAIKPYWISRPESGKRMRQRIERVLDAAKAKGLIGEPWQNPARLRGHLENLLPKRVTAVKHRAAMPFEEVAAFMVDLRQMERMAALALEFTVLTAVRNLESRGARKREVDLAAKVWTVPAERMKGVEGMKRPHRVPLSDAALAVLDRAGFADLGDDDLIFPGPKGGMFSENALQNVLTDMGLKGKATVHGFRSTFRDWAGETTNFQRETIEAALAHRLGDDTERAYRRGDALLKRRKLMEAWAGFLARPAGANVRPLSRPAP